MKKNLNEQKPKQEAVPAVVSPQLPRASRHELQSRINYAYELMMIDLPSGEVVKALQKKFDVSDRQAQRYLFYANKFLEEKSETSLKRKISWYKTRKQRLLRDMDPAEKKTAVGVMAVNKVLDSMAKLEGLMVRKVEIAGDKNKPIEIRATRSLEINYQEIPTEVLEALLLASPQKHLTNG